jgi:homogentisate 1,2-dioxygenase
MPIAKLEIFLKTPYAIWKPNGGFLYYEQLFGTEGFHGHLLLYHVHRPTQVKEITNRTPVEPKIAIGKDKIIITKRIQTSPRNDSW